ncbi:adipocyte plasma membrane-associated protein-like protein [Dinothrombium tinctorium]|uniref:Adipocyte plasma membrane-associated protein-like protein n=1 Tax=Dinothrombium tinctorium TaxID=1965070 RepID=A0A3S3PEB7_9ACAR|nr:adipocyte plasma membrane-associated protein-like protein [Dinothrombium tinctorium]RWS10634.1 adipocyte plasma membrane-associated protein-like protein [Dinothrombium tinctorium]RWS11362.1 adipocyte plasma membrane-associated protein-like protein [Dinothrombium tinctorium]RWS17859.1 adipocyte plasma membrane-associated protein-like protein [Dinothrombium tinctorium]
MFFVTKLLELGFGIAFLFLLLLYAPFLLDINPKSYDIQLPKSFSGPLRENDLLSKTEHMFKGEIKAASIVKWNGDLYSALDDGRIVRIMNNRFTVFANLSEGICEGAWDEDKCGHPLGIRIDSKGNLYIVDAYFGLKKVELKKDNATFKTIFGSNTQVNGRLSKFLFDVDIDERVDSERKNVYYISDASSKWNFRHAIYSMAEHDRTGRILRFDESTNKTEEIASNLAFPTGVQLTDSKDSLIVSLFNERRLIKLNLNPGSSEVIFHSLLENLPGEPMNIRRSSNKEKETYWVMLMFGRNASNPTVVDKLSDKPMLRKAVFRAVHAFASILKYLGKLLNFTIIKRLSHNVHSFEIVIPHLKYRGLAIEIDVEGKILRSLHSPDGHVVYASEAREVNENGKKVLYVGSIYNDYLGKLNL